MHNNLLLFSYLELPASYIEQNLKNTVITREINHAKVAPPEPKVQHGDISKSSINNDPIYMIYPKENYDDGTHEKKVRKSLWHLPIANKLKLVWWIYTWPIKFVLTMTIPNPKTFRKLYPLTFIMCIIWIGLNAYMIVWMITIMGS